MLSSRSQEVKSKKGQEELSLKSKTAKINDVVWVPDPEAKEGFIVVEIVEIKVNVAIVVPYHVGKKQNKIQESDKIRVPWHQVFPVNPENQNGVPDNTELMHLHDAALLWNLKHRYLNGNIYTYTAFILIAINPYKETGLYGPKQMEKYRGKSLGLLPPHVYATADRAFRSMKALKQNQSIVVSGESGAGKTENCKFIMRYLTSISKKSGSDLDELSLEKQILEANPILEAFGNAKTLRNNNSSRFGKFTEMNFDKDNSICGASVVTYLLEKSRLVSQAKGERNYHIFYQLLAGASEADKGRLHLGPAESFHYLNQSGCTTIENQSDKDGFNETVTAMKVIGLKQDTIDNLLRILAGLLHLGNISFKKDRQDRAQIIDSNSLEIVATLFGIDIRPLEKALITRTLRTGRSGEKPIVSPLKDDQAAFSRDALAKDIYGRVFDWLVEQINDVLISDRSQVVNYIGVLDIFGFEFFDHNSFEQLCINHANERLQLHFNQQVLQQEQELYEREAIKFDPIEYEDNSQTIDLVDKPRQGIFSILDEECVMPKATSKTLTMKIHNSHQGNSKLKFARMSKNRQARKLRDDEAFALYHFAGEVVYETEGFLEKNNDTLISDLEEMLQTSTFDQLRDLYPIEEIDPASSKKGKKFKSVGGKFSRQLKDLAKSLSMTTSHFVRCVKPNSAQVPNQFGGSDVLQQLRCSGMLEALLLMHAGFPTRCGFEDLYIRYKDLMPQAIANLDAPEFCEALLMALDVAKSEYQLGITKIFFRAGKLAFLEELSSSEYKEIAYDIAEKVRKWLLRKKLRRCLTTVISHIRLTRRLNGIRALKRVSRAAILVFLIYGTWIKLARKIHKKTCARSIQSVFRMHRERKVYLDTRMKIEKMQAAIKGFVVYRRYYEERQQLKREREEKKKRMEEEEKRRREEERNRRIEERKKREEDAKMARQRQIEDDRAKAKERIRRMEEKRARAQREKEGLEPIIEPVVAVESQPVVKLEEEVKEEEKKKEEEEERKKEAAKEVISVGVSVKEWEKLKEDFERNIDVSRTRTEEEGVKAIKQDMRLKELEKGLVEALAMIEEEKKQRELLASRLQEMEELVKQLSSSDEGDKGTVLDKMERLGFSVAPSAKRILDRMPRPRASSVSEMREKLKAKFLHKKAASHYVVRDYASDPLPMKEYSDESNKANTSGGYSKANASVPAIPPRADKEEEMRDRTKSEALAKGVAEKKKTDESKPASVSNALNKETLKSLNSAIDGIIKHFGMVGEKEEEEMENLGNDEENRQIVPLVRGQLCTALAKVLSFGFNSFKLFGRYHIWDVFEKLELHRSVHDVNRQTADTTFEQGISIINQLHYGIKNKDVKFRALMCHGLNEGFLHEWFLLFDDKSQSVVKKMFEPWSFVRSEEHRSMISSKLSILSKYPFNLSLDFELRRWDI